MKIIHVKEDSIYRKAVKTIEGMITLISPVNFSHIISADCNGPAHLSVESEIVNVTFCHSY